MRPFLPTIVAALRYAFDVNYPVGAETWSGQPIKILPVASKLTPNEHPAAEELNYVFNDRGERLTESRADLLAIQRRAEIASLRYTGNRTEDMRGACETGKGKTYRAVGGATAQDFARYVKGNGFPLALGFPAQPAFGGNRTPTFLQANGELVLIGDSPSSYIYNADTGAFSGAITLPGTAIILDAIPLGTGWLALCVADLAYAAFAVNRSAPRTYGATGAAFQVRTISAAGAIGADTASGALAAAETNGLFAAGNTIRPHFIRGKGSDVMALFSGRILSRRYAAYSSDDGATWVDVTLPDPFAGTATTWSIEYCSITEQFVLVVDNFVSTNVYNSVTGAVWTLNGATYFRAPAAAWGHLTFGPYDIRRMSSGVIVALSHVCADTLGSLYSPIHVSEDGGTTWNLAELVPLLGAGFHTLGMHSAGSMCLGGGSNDSRYGANLLGAQGI